MRRTGKKTVQKLFDSVKGWLDERFRIHPEEFGQLREISVFCSEHSELRKERLSPYEVLMSFYAVGKKGRSSDNQIARDLHITPHQARISRKIGLCFLTDAGRKGNGHWKFHSKIRKRVENILKLFNQNQEKESKMNFGLIRKEVLVYIRKHPDRFKLFETITGIDAIAAKKDGRESTIPLVFDRFINHKFLDDDRIPFEIVEAVGITGIDEVRIEKKILIALCLIEFQSEYIGDYAEEVRTEAENLRRRASVIEREKPLKVEDEQDGNSAESSETPTLAARPVTTIPEVVSKLWWDLAESNEVEESKENINYLILRGPYLSIFRESLSKRHPNHKLTTDQMRQLWSGHFVKKGIAKMIGKGNDASYEILHPASSLIKVSVTDNYPKTEELLGNDSKEGHASQTLPISNTSAPTTEELPEVAIENAPAESIARILDRPDGTEIGYVFQKNIVPEFLQLPTQESVKVIEEAVADSEERLGIIRKTLKEAEMRHSFIIETLGIHRAFLNPNQKD